jgi:RNA recognition motif-containing protein
MSVTLYVSNLAPNVTSNQLADTFKDTGKVDSIQFIKQPAGSEWPRSALVELDAHSAAWQQLNGVELEGHRLAVSQAEPDLECDPTPETQQIAQQISEQLDEPANAQKRVERVVRFGGIQFSQAIVAEALRIEEHGGILTQDRSRRRTPGGVFFYLARGRVSKATRKQIFYVRKKRKKNAAPPDENTQPAPQAPPKPKPVTDPRPNAAPPPANAQEQLAELQQELEAAQAHLDKLKADNASQQTGMFSAIKTVLDLQKQIKSLLEEYPELNTP